jgi:type 1 glutamine amidotransferase
MKVLVLCDDYWHPSQVPREGLGAIKESEFTFDWIENAHDWSAELMATYPLVILTKSNNTSATDRTGWMTDAAQAVFADYVRQGNGLLAIHSGTADYDQMPVMRSLLGGAFSHHPEQCLVTMVPSVGHQLCTDSDPFTLKDEHYFMTMHDPKADVFMTTRSEHGEQPGAWRRTESAGRVAVLTPGHNVAVWLHPSFRSLLLNALRWCGKLL